MASYSGSLMFNFTGDKGDLQKMDNFMKGAHDYLVTAGWHKVGCCDGWGFMEDYNPHKHNFEVYESVSWDYIYDNTLEALCIELIHRFPNIHFDGELHVVNMVSDGPEIKVEFSHKAQSDLNWQTSFYDPDEDENADEDDDWASDPTWEVDTVDDRIITDEYYQETKEQQYIPIYLLQIDLEN